MRKLFSFSKKYTMAILILAFVLAFIPAWSAFAARPAKGDFFTSETRALSGSLFVFCSKINK